MTLNLDRLSVAQLRSVFPEFDAALKRRAPRDYTEFSDILYDDFRSSFIDLERHAETYHDKSEDDITTVVCHGLSRLGYSANHDASRSGHVDIVVGACGYEWFGEAKIFRKLDDMNEGFLQLVTRYSSASGDVRGGLIAYVQTGDTAGKVAQWRSHLEGGTEHENLTTRDCGRRPGIAFYSVHKHQGSGLNFEVWHNGITLHFNPKDKSRRHSDAKRKGQSQGSTAS